MSTTSESSTFKISSYSKPTLKGGTYTIRVSQELHETDQADGISLMDQDIMKTYRQLIFSLSNSKKFGEQYNESPISTLEQKVYVSAPQFTLGSNDIHTFYPSNGARDNFMNDLPYVVFTKHSLPWERSFGGDNNTTWLALLLFTENEVSQTYTGTIDDFLTQADVNGGQVTPLMVPNVKADAFIDTGTCCQYIEIPLRTFLNIAPRADELQYLTHVCNVAMENKADMNMNHQGKFSTLLANRFPLPGKKHIVHMVSLEGCEQYLNKDITSTGTIRLLSLASWTFECLKGNDNFNNIATQLLTKDADNFLLRLPQVPDVQEPLKSRLSDGYAPLPYRVMSGEDTFAWYRGPLSPVRIDTSQTQKKGFLSASSAMRFDPNTGVFDLSYSVAWQLGRSLALADPNFGPRLMQLRRKAHYALDAICDRLFTRNLITNINEKQYISKEDKQSIVNYFEKDVIDLYEPVFAREITAAIDQFKSFIEKEKLQTNDFISPKLITEPDYSGYTGLIKEMLDMLSTETSKETKNSKLIDTIISSIINYISKELNEIRRWLNDLTLMNIPFYNLIPHERLLPPESIRFFCMDMNWWHALYDGTLNVSIHSTIDEAFFNMLRKWYSNPASISLVRTKEDVEYKNRNDQWGVFLRSKLVKGWAGLELYAFKDNELVAPVLTKKLADDLLLFLFEKAPDKLELREPKEGLRFGADISNNQFVIKTKYTLGENAGQELLNDGLIVFRQDNSNHQGVVDIKETVSLLQNILNQKQQLSRLNSAGFALQLLNKPERFIIEK
jgi:hypothetical protein